MRGEEGGNKNQRIKVQEKFYRIAEGIITFWFCLDKEEEEKDKKKSLCNLSEGFLRHSAS